MARGKRTIRASEIGSFLYCHRAWWYQRKKTPTINTAELAGGEHFHHAHITQSRAARGMRMVAWLLLIAALLLILFIALR